MPPYRHEWHILNEDYKLLVSHPDDPGLFLFLLHNDPQIRWSLPGGFRDSLYDSPVQVAQNTTFYETGLGVDIQGRQPGGEFWYIDASIVTTRADLVIRRIGVARALGSNVVLGDSAETGVPLLEYKWTSLHNALATMRMRSKLKAGIGSYAMGLVISDSGAFER